MHVLFIINNNVLCVIMLGYLNEDGDLNLPRFEKYLEKLAEHDIEQFRDGYADLKWLEGKIGGKAVNEEAVQARKPKSKVKLVRIFACRCL